MGVGAKKPLNTRSSLHNDNIMVCQLMLHVVETRTLVTIYKVSDIFLVRWSPLDLEIVTPQGRDDQQDYSCCCPFRGRILFVQCRK